MEDNAVLIIDKADVTYANGFTAVRNASLQVQSGEIVALLGASGSGKSTLLRAIAGLEKVTAGAIYLHGKDLVQIPVHKRDVGMVFQDGQLFPHRNVARNIAYGLEMRHLPSVQIKAEVEKLLQLVGLVGYEERQVSTLSGGQKQRVALARSLAPHPQLLLLDEPLSALDRKLRESLAVQLREIIKSTGTTAIFVTHDHSEAEVIADRTIYMEAGYLQSASAAEVN